MIDSTTTILYTIPQDSPGVNVPVCVQPRYFTHISQGSVNTEYSASVSQFKTRTGKRYRTRNDVGYLRSINFTFFAPNLESLHVWEYYFRSYRDKLILPYWPAYMTLPSGASTTTLVVDSIKRNVASEDYVMVLEKDFSKYSIRAITSLGPDTQIHISSLMDWTFSNNSLVIPMVVGFLSSPPRFEYAPDRTSANISLILSEIPIAESRTFIN